MSNRYDKQTTTFSQQGRLYQVEYAIEAIKQSGPSLAVLGKDCVVVIGGKKENVKLLDQGKQPEKIFEIDDHVCVAVAGITSDANILIQKLRHMAQHYTFRFGEPIPIEQLAVGMCDLKQSYTQVGGNRPFGVSFLFCGFDRHYGFQIFESNPAGDLIGWKAHCIGSDLWNSQQTTNTLKQDWQDGLSMKDVKELMSRIVVKNENTSVYDADRYEMAQISFGDDGKICYKRLKKDEVNKLLLDAKAKEDADAPK